MNKKYSIIVCVEKDNGIGMNGKIPWRLKEDMKYFKELTTKTTDPISEKINAIVSGSKTYRSYPKSFRPLSGRINTILTNNISVDWLSPQEMINPLIRIYGNFEDAISELSQDKSIDRIFIGGGSEVYKKALETPNQIDTLYITRILNSIACDTFFPQLDMKQWKLINQSKLQKEGLIEYYFEEYQFVEN